MAYLTGRTFGSVPALPGEWPEFWPFSEPDSNPGIRRPRWGGVVEGVAGQIRHPLAYAPRTGRDLRIEDRGSFGVETSSINWT